MCIRDRNTSKAGTYEIIYSVVDIAGNVSESVKRTVVISGEVTENPISYWWSNSSNIGNGFYQNWLGTFMPFASGWIFHLQLGWVYVVEDGENGLWLWSDQNRWIWSRKDVWPFMWSSETSDWLYALIIGNRLLIYDYGSQRFQ